MQKTHLTIEMGRYYGQSQSPPLMGSATTKAELWKCCWLSLRDEFYTLGGQPSTFDCEPGGRWGLRAQQPQ